MISVLIYIVLKPVYPTGTVTQIKIHQYMHIYVLCMCVCVYICASDLL